MTIKQVDFFPYILKYGNTTKTIDEYYDIIVKEMGISKNELSIKNAGGEAKVRNGFRWALQYLFTKGLMGRPSRGKYLRTEKGAKLFEKKGQDITKKDIEGLKDLLNINDDPNINEIEEKITAVHNKLKEELKQYIFAEDGYFFEYVVIDLINAMGYGRAEITKRTNDGGIDGEVYLDKFGLDVAAIQAKRHSGTIGRPDIQKFIGAMGDTSISTNAHSSDKGIFITTSDYSKQAKDCAQKSPKKISLINGEELYNLLIEYQIGVERINTRIAGFDIFEIDTDYFNKDSLVKKTS